MSKHVGERLKAAGPKRMLALDGGGTRGVITIAFLRRIEAVLQQRLGRNDSFVLADYFDMIGGTSVGSLLATMLALGFRVSEIESRFAQWSTDIFRNRRMKLPHWLQPRFDSDALSEKIRLVVRHEPLRTERLKTGLCVVAKRADTSSVWVLSNNPAGRFWADQGDQVGNRDYQLHDIIRASTAAPTFFRSIAIPIFRGGTMNDAPLKRGRFLDGGVSPYNDPALQMLLMASLGGYNLGGADLAKGEPGRGWPLGIDNLLIVSVGTGAHTIEAKESWPALEAIEALKGVIGDGQELTLAMLQWLGRSSLNWHVDAEVGDVAGDGLSIGKILSYVRYDLPLDADWMLGRRTGVKPGPALKAELERCGLLDSESLVPALKAMQELIALDEMARLRALATAAAADLVQSRHFPEAFDATWRPAPPASIFSAERDPGRFPT